ncbi:MAG TPA: hypothetical protein VKX46_06435 [Ktedonobacteraceae bacterium]|nr:hypothetical protein [Ktedonobacteraceae bacterium]
MPRHATCDHKYIRERSLQDQDAIQALAKSAADDVPTGNGIVPGLHARIRCQVHDHTPATGRQSGNMLQRGFLAPRRLPCLHPPVSHPRGTFDVPAQHEAVPHHRSRVSSMTGGSSGAR